MNHQQIYNTVKAHLLSQNLKSATYFTTGEIKSYLYRGPDNTMCGIGPLIPNECYSSNIEGMSIAAVVSQYPRMLPDDIFNADNIPLLTDLQKVHDEIPVNEWASKLTKVAVRYGLSP